MTDFGKKLRGTLKQKSSQVFAIAGVLVFAGVGTLALLATHAATPTASFQAESGTITGSA